MVQVTVIVNKLNKRRAPVLDFRDKSNIVDIVRRGVSFPAEEVNNELGKWYKDADGFFYWGGGLTLVLGAVSRQIDYRKKIVNIPLQWTNTGGKNIKVAVLDTGFNLNHQDLIHLKARSVVRDFGGNGNTFDKAGHGTHIMGLLGASTTFGEGINGLIPDAQFFLYKVIRDDVGFLDMFVEAAILDAIEQKVDIINMSFNVPSAIDSPLHQAIMKAITAKIIMVSSAGENDNLIQGSLVFPAQFENVVSVGEATDEFAQSVHVNFNDQLDFIMPFVDQRSCWINDPVTSYHDLKGSSMASALVTGALASVMSLKNKTTNAIEELKTVSPKFTNSIFSDSTIKISKP